MDACPRDFFLNSLIFPSVFSLSLFFAQPLYAASFSKTHAPQASRSPLIAPRKATNLLKETGNSPLPSSGWNSGDAPLQPLTHVSAENDLIASAQAFYVSKGGSNRNSGSAQKPWASIQYAVSKLQAGDTLFITEGTYSENIKLSTSGTQGNFITIEGVGQVILDGSDLTQNLPGFDTNGQDYIRFKNLTINHIASAAIQIESGSQFIEVDGLHADGNKYAVRISDASHVTVRHAYANHSYNAFRAYGMSTDLLFEDVEAYNSKDRYEGMDPDYLNGDGFIFEREVSNVTVRNAISANHWDAGFDIKASNVLIENVTSFGNKNNFKTWGNNITIRSSLSHHAKRQLRSNGSTVEGNGMTVLDGTVRLVNVTLVDNWPFAHFDYETSFN